MRLDFHLDARPAAVFGVILLQTDEVLERELAPMFAGTDDALHHSRVPCAPIVTPETLAAMEAALPTAAALLPSGRGLDVVAYACTSGSTVIGPARVAAIIDAAHPGAKATDPVTAARDAGRHLGARRLGLVTPYAPSVSAALRERLVADGFEIAAFGAFEEEDDARVAQIAEAAVLEAAVAVGAAATVDAVFLSCTNLRSFGMIEAAEARLGKPVFSSNAALAWRMLTLAGRPTAGRGPGRLFAG